MTMTTADQQPRCEVCGALERSPGHAPEGSFNGGHDFEIDHSTCPPSAHDFDPDGCPDQARDAQGRRRCNDCGALCFYCTNDEWYHHATIDGDVPACFLVKERPWAVLVPDAIPVPADWPGNECNRLPEVTNA